jgi:calcium-binding protein CML
LGFKFAKEVCDHLFKFFDKDDSNSVTLEEIEQTLSWGKERKSMRPLLAGWRQLSLDIDSSTPVHQQIREALNKAGKHPIELFKNWDDDGNGTMSKAELGALMEVLSGMRLSDSELDKLFDSFDRDHSGKLSFKELQMKLSQEVPIEQLMAVLSKPEYCNRMFELFHEEWDKDGDGTLSKEEFVAAMESLGVQASDPESLNDLFRMLDEDNSGAISLKELEHCLRWVRSCDECQKLRSEAYTFDGTLSIQQQIKRALAANAVRVLDLFREWDENGDGLISEAEFFRAMPLLGIHVGKKEVLDLFKALDHDGDGVVAFREFNRMLRREQDEMGEFDADDPFGRNVKSSWQPKQPTVAVIDVNSLRLNMKTEHRLRGLDQKALYIAVPNSRVPVILGDRLSPVLR